LNFPGVSPDCSPDGKQIVDLTMGLSQIFIMNIDGSNPVELLKADNISSPRWSPDGKQIAYVKGYPDSGITDYSNILVINIDGSNQTQLTTATEKNIYNVNPIWTSDGKIAFIQSSVGSQDKHFIMNSDGTKVSEISKDVYDNYSKEWSPDKTAYVREVDGPFDIAIFNADGTVSVRLFDDKISDFSPTWCP
jgi:TolB protein